MVESNHHLPVLFLTISHKGILPLDQLDCLSEMKGKQCI